MLRQILAAVAGYVVDDLPAVGTGAPFGSEFVVGRSAT